ncbi:hypothetical protein SPFM12_00023 [Salmonella phage SPFM12]|nr:hypothetical protein SPFM12_00023 [Salmonella phage SPFM12]
MQELQDVLVTATNTLRRLPYKYGGLITSDLYLKPFFVGLVADETWRAKNPIVCDITDLLYKPETGESLGNQDAWKFLIIRLLTDDEYLISERDKRLKDQDPFVAMMVCAKAESNEADFVNALIDYYPEGVFTMTNQLHYFINCIQKELRYILLR